MIITLKTEFIGEMINWEMALCQLGNPEDDTNYYTYRDEDGLYCIEVEEEEAKAARLDLVTITFETARAYREFIQKMEEWDVFYYYHVDDPDKLTPVLKVTTFRTYALKAGVNVEPDNKKG